MPKQSILVATENGKVIDFLSAYFADTQSIPSVIRSKGDLSALSDCHPDVMFFEGDWVDKRALERLEELKRNFSKLKSFCLGSGEPGGFSWDGNLELPLDEKVFRKVVLEQIELPDPIKLVIVDDEKEVIEVVQDYFEVRKHPSFKVRTAPNGLEGFKLIEQEVPHCLILDIKMPVRTGVELYRDLVRGNQRIPTVIFIDSTTSEDILEIRKWGAPVFIEKGGPSSTMPDMMALVKKLVAFS